MGQVSFQVNPQALRDLSRDLESVQRQLTKDAVRRDSGRLGVPKLNEAVENFAGEWDDSFNVLETKIREIVECLRQAADAYEKADKAVEKALSGSG